MSEKKRAWWKFWKKKPKTPPDEEEVQGHHMAAAPSAGPPSANVPPPSMPYPDEQQGHFSDDLGDLDDPDGTVDLHSSDIRGFGAIDDIDGDTLNLGKSAPTNLLPVPERTESPYVPPSAPLSESERAARVQAARERAARHKGRFGVGVPSSDALPAASQEALTALSEEVEAPAEPTQTPEEGEHPAPGALFAGCLSLLGISLSLPLWLTSWPPMRDLPGHIGLIAAFQHLTSSGSNDSLFQFTPGFYAGSGGDYLLSLAAAIFPLSTLTPLLLQIYILTSLFALLYLLLVAECSLWSACLGLLLLFNGAFFEGNMSFLLATPVLFVGLAFLLQWMAHGKTWAAIAATATAWALLILDPTAYTLYLAAALMTAFLFSSTMASLVIRVLLPASSLLLVLPWLLILGSAKAAAFGASNTAPALSWSPYSDRLGGLITRLGWPLHSNGGAIAMAGIVILLSCGIVMHLLSKRSTQSKHLRSFFPLLTLLWLSMYLLFPVQWRGTPVTASAILSFVGFSLLGWLHIDLRRTAGKLLLTSTLLWGLVVASLFTIKVLQHKQRVKPLQQMLLQVPPKGRLLLWQLPGKRPQDLAQAGGYYMAMAPGNQSNIDLRSHLRWKFVSYRKPYHVPSATSVKRPNLQGWDYLLTGWKPSRKERPYFRLLRKYGPYYLYRIQVP